MRPLMDPGTRSRLEAWVAAGKRVYGYRLGTEEAPEAVFALCLLIFRLDLRLGGQDGTEILPLVEEALEFLPVARAFWEGQDDPGFREALAVFLAASDGLAQARAAG